MDIDDNSDFDDGDDNVVDDDNDDASDVYFLQFYCCLHK